MTGDGQLLLAIALGAACVVLLLAFLAFGIGRGTDRTVARIDNIHRRWQPAAEGKASTLRLERSAPGVMNSWMPRREALRIRLARTGRNISPGQYAFCSMLCLLVAGALLHLVLGRSLLVAGLGGVAAGLGLPHIVVGGMIGRRIGKFLGDFPDGIDLIVRGLKSGLPIQETIATVGNELPQPVGPEFRRIEAALRLGQSLEEALWTAAARIDIAEFRFFVISLSVQRETGGNLAETLENLADILRRRRQMKLKIRALSSEARASAYIIGSLPFIMCLILLLINPGYVLQLFSDPRGMILVGVALTSIGIGALVMARMIRFEI